MSAWTIATTAIFAVAVAAIAYREFQAYLVWLEAVRLRAQAKPVVDRRLEHLAGRLDPIDIAPILATDLTSRDTSALVLDRSHRVIGSAPPLEGPDPPLLPEERYLRAFAEDPHVTSTTRDGDRRRVLSVLIPPLPWRPEPPAIVQLSAYLDSRERPLRFLRILAAVILADLLLVIAFELALEGPLTLLALAAVPLVWAAARVARVGGTVTVEQEARPAARRQGTTPLATAVRRAEAAFLAQQAADERIRGFMAGASHELRTPLTSIAGAADLLLGRARNDSETVERLASVIRSQADRMSRLVDDLLTLARMERPSELRRGHVQLDELAAEHGREIEHLADGRRISIAAEPVTVLGDPDRLGQILANLTSNALRHTSPGGEIRIAARVEDGSALLSVSDDGEGIRPEDLPHVFTPFWRTDASRFSGGAGLGLAIVRELAEAHGGSVELESSPGKGTAVIVRLPCSPAATSAEA